MAQVLSVKRQTKQILQSKRKRVRPKPTWKGTMINKVGNDFYRLLKIVLDEKNSLKPCATALKDNDNNLTVVLKHLAKIIITTINYILL